MEFFVWLHHKPHLKASPYTLLMRKRLKENRNFFLSFSLSLLIACGAIKTKWKTIGIDHIMRCKGIFFEWFDSVTKWIFFLCSMFCGHIRINSSHMIDIHWARGSWIVFVDDRRTKCADCKYSSINLLFVKACDPFVVSLSWCVCETNWIWFSLGIYTEFSKNNDFWAKKRGKSWGSNSHPSSL